MRQFRLKHTYWTCTDSVENAGFGVIGSPQGRHPYKRLYLENQEGVKMRSHLYKGGIDIVRKLAQGRGLVVLSEIDLPLALEKETVQVPAFVDLGITLPHTLDAYYAGLPHSARDDIRRARKANYSYEISSDVNWVGIFFEQYYWPSMLGQHGEEAYVMPKTEIEALVREKQAEFVKICSEGVCLAAMLCQVEEKSFTFLRLGWLNHDEQYVKRGVLSALYWFLIQRAFHLQCSQVLLGGTPSYLENGVLKFKAKWGGCLWENKPTYGFRRLLLDPANPACYRFLKNVSLLAVGPGDSLLVLSSKLPNEVALPSRFLTAIKSWYVLRPSLSIQFQDEEALPSRLHHWYEKVPLTKTVCRNLKLPSLAEEVLPIKTTYLR
ncbi:hypothetical protein [Larkinella punicea]|uniref:Uncharacterized protein n=1 Tax=Larkinella punicea TaxID=2315727 RepID=A0A368JEB2_9BACT|nr:hypothetical protein [Larkinella punicea]RCR65882.1 hypothetical protein DUE52_29915 [Larkinella punicea]